MRLKSVVKYNINDMKFAVLIYYIVIAALMCMSGITIKVGSNGATFYSGAQASAIFLFVCGLNSFKQNYLYLSTNGVTRKTQFFGFLVSSAIIAAGISFIDTATTNISNLFINYKPIFYYLYDGFVAQSSQLLITIMNFLWSTIVYFLALVIGYFITTLYYRMSKTLKIIVSIGVPALLLIVVPIIIERLSRIGYSKQINNFVAFFGIGYGIPALALIIYIVEIAIVAGLAYLLVRRAAVKE